ncbi:hypothetical protein DSO57_1009296 [Entomophthora muscae]|uniref:Uncharacterized protein n=1 Tax=Entomophthora muscae TaxID=34485 RepID=A0ACC2RLG6_9FUNG|nr:hypothetical protein DSO57_1009296 [Entomophthora muscae]
MQFVFLFAGSLAFQDPCASLSGKRVVKYHEAMACYNNFKLVDEVKNSTLATLRQAMQVFPRHFSVVEAGLDMIREQSFGRELEFHQSLAGLYSKVGMRYDGGCFSTFQFHLPLELVVYQDNSKHRVHVASQLSHVSVLTEYWHGLKVYPERYQKKHVTKIQSVDALAYLKGFVKDQGISWSEALAHGAFNNGVWQPIPGLFSQRTVPPKSNSITFEFSDGSTLAAPILATVPSLFNGSHSFYTNLCASSRFTLPPPVINGIDDARLNVKRHKAANTRHTALFQLGNVGAILAIPSFVDSLQWEKEISASLAYISRKALDELIIDLRDSSGDHYCGSYALLNHFRTFTTRYPATPSNSAIIHNIVDECISKKQSCLSIPTFVKPLQCHPHPSSNPSYFLPSRIHIVTNGLCKGACAILVHGLMENSHSKFYFVGLSTKNPPLGTTSIPYSLTQFITEASMTKSGRSPLIPAPLLTRANLYFNVAQFYTMKNAIPVLLDDFFPATIPLQENSDSFIFDPTHLWNTILNTNLSISLLGY